MQIFDSWGNLIWQTEKIREQDGKPETGWDGRTLDGKPCPQGTYIWKIYAKFSDGTTWENKNGNGEVTGTLYLIR